jgi:general secretion pathway protein G
MNLKLERGFTLIELLVVLAIVGLMLTIATPRYVDHVERAREATLRATLKEIRIALDRFEADRGKAPETIEELVERRYLRELPVDPITERRDTWLLLTASESALGETAAAADAIDVRSGAEGSSRDGTLFRDF